MSALCTINPSQEANPCSHFKKKPGYGDVLLNRGVVHTLIQMTGLVRYYAYIMSKITAIISDEEHDDDKGDYDDEDVDEDADDGEGRNDD